MRNSVKVVIDAYDGTVKAYIADPDDPLIRTLARIFPGLLQPDRGDAGGPARARALSRTSCFARRRRCTRRTT